MVVFDYGKYAAQMADDSGLAAVVENTHQYREHWSFCLSILLIISSKGAIIKSFRQKRNGEDRKMTAIIDYNAGNLKSVEKALALLGEPCTVTGDAGKILAADRVILPGVGAFGDAMQQLKQTGLDAVIREVVERNTPFLGICLGLQLLFEGSEESGGVEGLGILDGKILRIPEAEGLKIPHIGWNSLELTGRGRLFEGIGAQSYVYFVHSYYLKAADVSIVTAQTEYGVTIHASVEKNNVFACQFHPEKSSAVGLRILKNFTQIKAAAQPERGNG